MLCCWPQSTSYHTPRPVSGYLCSVSCEGASSSSSSSNSVVTLHLQELRNLPAESREKRVNNRERESASILPLVAQHQLSVQFDIAQWQNTCKILFRLNRFGNSKQVTNLKLKKKLYSVKNWTVFKDARWGDIQTHYTRENCAARKYHHTHRGLHIHVLANDGSWVSGGWRKGRRTAQILLGERSCRRAGPLQMDCKRKNRQIQVHFSSPEYRFLSRADDSSTIRYI